MSLRIVLVHNYYQQAGGEDQVFAAESALLEKHGHGVIYFTVHNDAVDEMSRLALAKATVWNSRTYREFRALLRRERPDLIHVHNTLPLVSPSVYYAANDEGVPVVQTLHNYRLLCVNGLLHREGHVCEECVGKAVPWPGVAHGCYRDSQAASGVMAAMLTYHRLRGTYQREISLYIALTEFARNKFIEGGLPADKIVVKPNFLEPDPGMGQGGGGYALYVGRLSEEKGLGVLLQAWRSLGAKIPLKVVGDGPMGSEVDQVASEVPGVEWLGRQAREHVLELMMAADVLVLPSACYEGFPMTLVEAFAVGVPVICSDLGSLASLIMHEHTGLLFHPGDPTDLAAKVEWALRHPNKLACIRKEARAEFEGKYTAEENYRHLMEVYERGMVGG